MFAVMNVYCERCRHCIGFRTSIKVPVGVFCLNCESAVVADMEHREREREEYERQVRLVQTNT